MLNVYVIGCGGVGGYLIERLPMAISSLSLDITEAVRGDINDILENAGNQALASIVDRLVLVDGDTFNPRNALRQGMGAGGKLVQRMRAIKAYISSKREAADKVHTAMRINQMLSTPGYMEELQHSIDVLTEDKHLTAADMDSLQREMVKVSFLQQMQLIGYNEYIRPSIMSDIIVKNPVEPDSAGGVLNSYMSLELRRRLGAAVVFLCVDNLKTRYEVSKYMEAFDDCIVFNGGNSKTVGHVTVYERSQGKALDPALYEIYPGVTADADKRPDEMECAVVAPKHDQIAVTNSIIADVMLARFIQWARKGLTETKKSGEQYRYNEILIDIEKPSMTPLYHPLSSIN